MPGGRAARATRRGANLVKIGMRIGMRWRDNRVGQPACAPPFPPACQDACKVEIAESGGTAQLLRPPPLPSQPCA